MAFKKAFLIAGVLISLGIAAIFLYRLAPWESGEDILKEFYKDNHDLKGSALADILIINSKKVCPLVCKEIKDKNMPHRRYAIGFLGNEKYKPAKKVLIEILSDETELDHFRADALIALYQLDESIGKEYVSEYKQQDDFLGYVAKHLANCIPIHRSFWDAFFHRDYGDKPHPVPKFDSLGVK
jgi:HEAT repeat protein